jgi:hypothetical protein
VFDQAIVFNMCNVVCCATIVLLISIFEEYSTELTSVDYSSYHIPYSTYSSVASPVPVGSTGDTKYNITNSENWTHGVALNNAATVVALANSGIEQMELNQTCMRPIDFTQYLLWENLAIVNNYTNVDSNNLLCSTFDQNYSSAYWQMYSTPVNLSSSVIQFASQFKCSLRCANAVCPDTNGDNNPGQDKHIRSAFLTTYDTAPTFLNTGVGKDTHTSGVKNFIGDRLFFKWQARGIGSWSAFVFLYDQVSLSL